MIIDSNYSFSIGVSVNSYKTKDDAKLCLSSIGAKSANMDKMAFYNNLTISVDDFVTLATSGYAFCNIFKYNPKKLYYRENTNPRFSFKYIKEYPEYKRGNNKGAMKLQFKSDDFFGGSQCIFIDIDFTNYKTLDEYISKLKDKPTFAYCTYSDKPTKRKFRLCYIFDKVLDEVEFIKTSKQIHRMISEYTGEEIIDDCGTRESQYFNGTTNNSEIYQGNFIYSTLDFEDKDVSSIIPSIEEDNSKPQIPVPDLNFISDMERLDYDEFMHIYSKKFKYFWRVDNGNWINNKIQIVDDNYFSLFYNTKKLKDGMCRRRKLYQRMCLRRIINPDSTPDDILFNSYVDLAKFIDNTEDIITIQDLVRNVKSCFRFSIDELSQKFSEVIKIAKDKTRPKNGKIYKNKLSIKEGNYSLIDQYYNKNLTPKENIEILEKNNVNISLSTIYNYCKDRNIKTKIDDKDIFDLLDLSLSLRNNKKLLEDSYSIFISKDKINKIMKEFTNT